MYDHGRWQAINGVIVYVHVVRVREVEGSVVLLKLTVWAQVWHGNGNVWHGAVVCGMAWRL